MPGRSRASRLVLVLREERWPSELDAGPFGACWWFVHRALVEARPLPDDYRIAWSGGISCIGRSWK
jgi:hypothetical protein